MRVTLEDSSHCESVLYISYVQELSTECAVAILPRIFHTQMQWDLCMCIQTILSQPAFYHLIEEGTFYPLTKEGEEHNVRCFRHYNGPYKHRKFYKRSSWLWFMRHSLLDVWLVKYCMACIARYNDDSFSGVWLDCVHRNFINVPPCSSSR